MKAEFSAFIIISIHTLHTEGDEARCPHFLWSDGISIHTLHTEGDRAVGRRTSGRKQISIHTLHTEGDFCLTNYDTTMEISIHTLHTEGDVCQKIRRLYEKLFQSTPSTRRVTVIIPFIWHVIRISIHTLHTEGDPSWERRSTRKNSNFNPHPPHGG